MLLQLLAARHVPRAAARRAASTSSHPRRHVLALRREDKNRWERRVALTPAHVQQLVQEHGATVLVQPSNNRVFNDKQYAKAGAVVQEDLSPADVIVGIKEVPIERMLPNKTYVVFSHTHKGQAYNRPSLKAFLDKNIRLVDYELMVNDKGKRTVLFGRHAGYAGMIDGLHGLGLRLLGRGYNSPFMYIGMSHTFRSLAAAKLSTQQIGAALADEGVPDPFGPMTFVFTGSGNVAQGAQEVFANLPHEYIHPSDLPALVAGKMNHKADRLYACQVTDEHHIVGKDGRPYVREEYRANPQAYTSTFSRSIAPYTSMLINGVFWNDAMPRLMTHNDLKRLQTDPATAHRMISIADISCDIGGSLEFMDRATTIDAPFFYYDAVTGEYHHDIEKPGVQINSVDNLPTELPLEASNHFSGAFFPYALEMLRGNFDHPVIAGATICHAGKLMAPHQHLLATLKDVPSTQTPSIEHTSRDTKNVVLLGSGMVARPLVDYLLRSRDVRITVASNMAVEAQALVAGRDNASAVPLDINDQEALKALVSTADVVVSFVPAPFHPQVAQACIHHKKHMVTASYISPAMRDLHAQAEQAGIAILNEMGLDPGIDHMSAMKIIDEARDQGGKVTSFISWCGGLPAPECSGDPLAYKFSWSPRGVLTAAQNDAIFKLNGHVRSIPGTQLLSSAFADVPLYHGFALEGLANRNSLSYVDEYSLGALDDLSTMFRGTLRYKGYARLMSVFYQLGLLDASSQKTLVSNWHAFMTSMVGSSDWVKGLKAKLGPLITHDMALEVAESMQWLVAHSKHAGVEYPTVLDAFAGLLSQSLAYDKDERDMTMMHHEFVIKTRSGAEEIRTSSLVAYANLEQQQTAMAKTVALPAAMAVEGILRGDIQRRGVFGPIHREVYLPVLDKLAAEGVVMKEATKQGRSMATAMEQQLTA